MDLFERDTKSLTWSHEIAARVAEDLLKSDILNPHQFTQARLLIARNILTHLNRDA